MLHRVSSYRSCYYVLNKYSVYDISIRWDIFDNILVLKKFIMGNYE